MKRRWMVVGLACIALIGAAIIVRTERENRQLAKRAAAYRIRADQGDAKAQLTLGWMYYYGKGLPKDYVEAARWYRKSADQGNARAQHSLGFMYHHGQGVSQDDAEAVRWYRKSVEQGYPKAQYNLGYMYYYGYGGVPRDRVEAVRLFQQAAAQGDQYAKRALACDRRGISIDPGGGLRGLQ